MHLFSSVLVSPCPFDDEVVFKFCYAFSILCLITTLADAFMIYDVAFVMFSGNALLTKLLNNSINRSLKLQALDR